MDYLLTEADMRKQWNSLHSSDTQHQLLFEMLLELRELQRLTYNSVIRGTGKPCIIYDDE